MKREADHGDVAANTTPGQGAIYMAADVIDDAHRAVLPLSPFIMLIGFVTAVLMFYVRRRPKSASWYEPVASRSVLCGREQYLTKSTASFRACVAIGRLVEARR
jgi:hypothetical protein